MTNEATNRRALVLGGGGPVGVAWEIGIAAGLASGGLQLRDADSVIGTSAGSIAGSLLKSGADAADLVAGVGAMFTTGVGDSGVDAVPSGSLAGLMELLIGATSDEDEAAVTTRMVEVGKVALAAETIPEDAFVGTIESALGGLAWPEGFSCTAVDVTSGAFERWTADRGVPLARAVASSCSVPGIYPPVTIDGARYMDGGMRSPLNADLATGHDTVVVISVMPMDLPAGLDDPTFERFFAAQRAEIDGLREGGASVEVIVPDDDFLALSGWGTALMDFSLVAPAAEAGTRLGKLEADRLTGHW